MACGGRLCIPQLLWCVFWSIFSPWSRGSFDTVPTIYKFYKFETQFNQFFSSNRNLNRGRYLRLMALSATEILATIPLGTYIIVRNAKRGVYPWISWENVHRDYSRVIQVPASVWKEDKSTYDQVEMFRWLIVASAFIFFGFFGFSDEARQHYRLVYTSLASCMTISATRMYRVLSGFVSGTTDMYDILRILSFLSLTVSR